MKAFERVGLDYALRNGQHQNFCDLHYNWPVMGDTIESAYYTGPLMRGQGYRDIPEEEAAS